LLIPFLKFEEFGFVVNRLQKYHFFFSVQLIC
jgi:hypothetical protein